MLLEPFTASNFSLPYPYGFTRRQTRVVPVGNLKIGGDNPIVLQSMLTKHTSDTAGCFAEIVSLVAAGCQMVRMSLLNKRDLEHVPELITMLKNEGINVPLVADVHFAAHLAVDACVFFDKIRINPGNYSDRPKNYKQNNNSRSSFDDGYELFKEKLKPLAANLLKYNRSLRIGVNHGSLSTRMIEKFGDSPLGMVESALEALQIMESLNVHNIVLSLKSSNPIVANQAYRLFAARNTGLDAVPLHLGVTEAGSEQIARVKSLCGISHLLLDGIGDTIRISLSEPSENEIEFGLKLINFINSYPKKQSAAVKARYKSLTNYRESNEELIIGDLKIAGSSSVKLGLPTSGALLDADFTFRTDGQKLIFKSLAGAERQLDAANLEIIDFDENFYQLRQHYLERSNTKAVALYLREELAINNFILEAKLAAIVCEGLVDIILVDAKLQADFMLRLADILQALRVKISQTDYVACPSCGRTMFDLAAVTARIKKETAHLKGVKIGILGCIVNGPGEMADSDFGYVGASSGKIDLYLGHKKVKQDIEPDLAVSALIELIKAEGRWVESKEVKVAAD